MEEVNQYNNKYSYKYFTTTENVKETLEKYGVAIIPNLLDNKECEKMIDDMWNYLERISLNWEVPLIRDDISTWPEAYQLYLNYEYLALLVQFWYIGHSQMNWNVRQNPKVAEVFANIWSVEPEELLVSFDGASIQLPPEITGFGFGDNKKWFHSDQNFNDKDFKYVQSWVTANQINSDDGTLAVLEGSHHYFNEFSETFKPEDGRIRFFTNEHLKFFNDRGCHEVKIACPKGSIVLWEGRTIHYGAEPMSTRQKENIRCVSYVSYLPRLLATEEDLEIKRNQFKDMFTTGHDAIKSKPSPKTPWKGISDYDIIIDPPKLTYLGIKLAGF
jgi:ectoine hydroxylase-related dioxygenase (phytanoyl-CoA dioxygenase family)